MKKLAGVVGLMLVSLMLVSGQTRADRMIDKEIRRLNNTEVEALLHNDAKTLAAIWSDDFVVTNPFNKFVTKQQVLGLVTSGWLAFTSFDRQLEYIRIYGSTVVVAGNETVVWAGKAPIAGKVSHLRITSVWMKQKGRWQQVARHANIVDTQ